MVIFGNLVTELVLWVTIGLLMLFVGFTWNEWQFWALILTYWAVSLTSRRQGAIEGVINYLNLPMADQDKIRRTLNDIQKDLDQ